MGRSKTLGDAFIYPQPAHPMPVLPKSFLTVGASFETNRMARRLARANHGRDEQQAAYLTLKQRIASTAYGQRQGVEARMTYEQFQARIPLQTYQQLAPYVRRMQQGEGDVLWPGQCTFYAMTTATSGAAKAIPVTEDMLQHFNVAARDALYFYTARVGHARVFHGRHLYLGASTTLQRLPDVDPFVAYAGDMSALAALNMPMSVEHHLYEPGAPIAQMTNWTEKIAAIVQRTLGADISLVAGVPPWLRELADALLAAATHGAIQPANLQEVWPRLECLVHGGMALAPFEHDLRRAYGPGVAFHEIYVASEGFIAAQDGTRAEGLRLMTHLGIFFEFLPLKEYDPARLVALGMRTVPLEEVVPDEDYVLVVTTPAGLCRYVLGDIVRFVSVAPPRLIHIGRAEHQLNAVGENVSEKEVTDAIVAVCAAHDWQIVNFHVAPLSSRTLTGKVQGRHEWWVELRAGSVQTPIGTAMSAELDHYLAVRNAQYAARRSAGNLETPVVRLVIPGVFEHWLRHHQRWGGRSRLPRASNDRTIADGLAQVTRFTDD
jgi:hypothetical protein